MRENLIYRLREKSRKNIWHESRGKRSLYTEFIERINLLFNYKTLAQVYIHDNSFSLCLSTYIDWIYAGGTLVELNEKSCFIESHI